jgi:hypothetical protein
MRTIHNTLIGILLTNKTNKGNVKTDELNLYVTLLSPEKKIFKYLCPLMVKTERIYFITFPR